MDNKKVTLEYILILLFVVIIALMLAGMVLGPFGFTGSSLALSGAACVLCLGALGVLFAIWRQH